MTTTFKCARCGRKGASRISASIVLTLDPRVEQETEQLPDRRYCKKCKRLFRGELELLDFKVEKHEDEDVVVMAKEAQVWAKKTFCW